MAAVVNHLRFKDPVDTELFARSDGPSVSVVQEAAGRFRVEVHGAGGTTTHTVDVPDGLAGELGWSTESEMELVRESFAFLLEREPPTSILRTFSLDAIGRYFPEYQADIRKRAPRGFERGS